MSASRPATSVLVVEDEAIVALDIERRLKNLGYAVAGTASTAQEAVRLAAQESPDLVLMDIRLRGSTDGIEAGRQIREQYAIPVVYLTAHADEQTLARAKATAPHGYVIKPFDEEKLRVTLELALAGHARETAEAAHRRELTAVLDALPMGAAFVDAEGRLTLANALCRRMLQVGERKIGLEWHRALDFSEGNRRAIEEQAARPVAERRRVALSVDDPGAPALEVDLVDDPRSEGSLILFIHDVSELRALRASLMDGAEFESMIGRSDAMRRVFQIIDDLARVDSPVLVRGETGTGKELVARALHRRSDRGRAPFVAVNCGGLSDELAVSQLFGHARGAFTGAVSDHRGYFEAAEGGVLFLDEIGELSDRVQASLLRVLEEQEVVRLGETQGRPVDVRLVVATHRDLESEIANGRFRVDLYYRIRVAQIDLPPLRERREDVPLLANAFLALARATTGKEVASLSQASLSALLGHTWPGNVRELRNAIEFGVIRSPGRELEVASLPPEILAGGLGPGEAPSEEDRIRLALTRSGGQRKRAAEMLGMSRATFYRRLRQYGIEPK